MSWYHVAVAELVSSVGQTPLGKCSALAWMIVQFIRLWT